MVAVADVCREAFIGWDEKAGLLRDAIRSQCLTCSRHKKRRPAVNKISTVQAFGNEIFKEQKRTIGVDLGDRWSFYCVLDKAGKVILEQKLSTTLDAMKQTFERCQPLQAPAKSRNANRAIDEQPCLITVLKDYLNAKKVWCSHQTTESLCATTSFAGVCIQSCRHCLFREGGMHGSRHGRVSF
jgi:hypothetical protein